MTDAKRAPREQGNSEPVRQLASFVRPHASQDAPMPPPLDAPQLGAESFLEDWALRHFTVSVKLHDAERLSEGDAERLAVLEDLAVVQGVLIELHEFATASDEVRALMRETRTLQNGVSALYEWLDDVLDAALLRRVARGRPSFVDSGEDSLPAIVGMLERLHPDLEALVSAGWRGTDEATGHKLSLCFRQIGAAIVRVSGRGVSSAPPR